MHNGGQTAAPRLKILVVGAGLSGLAAAISCALQGLSVRVIESAQELAEDIGAGLQITPNASRLLQRWGLSDALWASAAEPTSLIIQRYSNGRVLIKDDAYNINMRKRFGAPLLDVHRVDVQQALYQRAVDLGVQFEFGERVAKVDFDVPSVTTKAGNTFTGDLIVGADGLWSKCRRCFLQSEEAPRPTGDLAYRIVLTLDEIEDNELRELVSKPTMRIWIGPNAHAISYSLKGGKMFNIVLLVPDSLPPDVARQAAEIDELRALFKDWDPILNRFLDCVKSVDKWKLMHLPELKSWIHEKSKFVLIGDSCHPMLPYLAQGANSSIEDGAALGLILGRVNSKQELPSALMLYEQIRKKRGERIVRETFKQRHDSHLPDGPEQEARDELLLSSERRGMNEELPIKLICPKAQQWLFGYNAVEEAESALKQHPLHLIVT